MGWIGVYLSLREIISHVEAKNFMVDKFNLNFDTHYVGTKSVLVKSANRMTIVKRYHSPIRS